MEAAKII